MPVQSGSDRLLKRMSRRYSVEEYEARIGGLRAAVPGLTLSTDVIVGFPGETDEDFQQTLALVERVGFTSLFGFKYSPRPFTAALKLGDDVPEAVKSARLTALLELSSRLTREHLSRLVGGVERVLVEGRNRDGAFTGRTERNEIVHFAAGDDPTGEICEVRITGAFKHSLAGELCDAKRARPLERAPAERRRSLAVL
jgi:tRNA-2-methylthio-N6-dimethylallyladenosine synthase